MRFADWEERLAAYLDQHRETPFAWGRHDCCTFAFGAVIAMTGEDRLTEYRGRYSTARGSVRILRRLGGGTLETMLSGKFEPCPPALARRGDLVLVGTSVGVCLGPVAIFVGAEGERVGLVTEPRAAWDHAWRVA